MKRDEEDMELDSENFMTWFQDVLTMDIPQWIINPYSDIEETEEELIVINTNEKLKVQFRKGNQQFWFCYLSRIMDYREKVFDRFSIIIPRGKGCQRICQSFYKK